MLADFLGRTLSSPARTCAAHGLDDVVNPYNQLKEHRSVIVFGVVVLQLGHLLGLHTFSMSLISLEQLQVGTQVTCNETEDDADWENATRLYLVSSDF